MTRRVSAAVVALGVAVVVIAGGSLAGDDAVGPLAVDAPYDRDAFGRWTDADGDCQDARNEVLLRDLEQVVLSGDGCLVLSGILRDPYTGEVVEFVRGRATSSQVQVDHVLPLAEAWQAGAWRWTDEERRAFASDLDNLIATKGSVNSAKGARLPSAWVERITTPGAACEYVASVVVTAADWRLELPELEQQWIDGWFDGECPTPLTGR